MEKYGYKKGRPHFIERTLIVDGVERNKFKSQDAEKKYEDLLNYIKKEFIKYRDVVKN